MKKVDLLQALSSKFYKVLTPEAPVEEDGLKLYRVKVYDILGNERVIEDARVSYADLLAHEIVLEHL